MTVYVAWTAPNALHVIGLYQTREAAEQAIARYEGDGQITEIPVWDTPNVNWWWERQVTEYGRPGDTLNLFPE